MRLLVATTCLLAALVTVVFCAEASGGDRAARIDELMREYERLGLFSGAVLAAEEEDVVYEGAFGFANREWQTANTVDTRFRIASISKPFTQILVLQQVEDGRLDLDGTIDEYLPEYAGVAADKITVRQLLTHRSGIVGEWAVADLERVERAYHTRDRLLEHVAGYELWFEPGTHSGYSNFGYFLLGVIVEEVSGESYANLLEERICRPAGMRNTVVDVNRDLIERRAAGYHYDHERGFENGPDIDMSFVFGYGHLLSTVRDLYLWDRALRGGDFLSREHTDFVLQGAAELDPLGNVRREMDVVRFGGSINGFLCSTHSYTQDGRFVVVLANAKDPSGVALPSTFDVARNIAAVLYGMAYEPPKRSAASELYGAMMRSGIGAAGERYRSIRGAESGNFAFRAREFGRLGRMFARAGMWQEALALNLCRAPRALWTWLVVAACLVAVVSVVTTVRVVTSPGGCRRGEREKDADGAGRARRSALHSVLPAVLMVVVWWALVHPWLGRLLGATGVVGGCCVTAASVTWAVSRFCGHPAGAGARRPSDSARAAGRPRVRRPPGRRAPARQDLRRRRLRRRLVCGTDRQEVRD